MNTKMLLSAALSSSIVLIKIAQLKCSCRVSTGYQSASTSTSRWPRSFTVVWHFAIVSYVPGRRLQPSCCRRSWSAAAFHNEPNMRRDADIQHLWRQRSRLLDPDQSSIAPERRRHADLSYNEFRRSLRTFLFGQWGHGAV